MKCKECMAAKAVVGQFCSKVCRKIWCRRHEIKGAKKKIRYEIPYHLRFMGSTFNNETNCQDR